jgi:hypothetical protein
MLVPALLAAKPCGLIPGGALDGEPITAPADWRAFEGTRPCQLELRPEHPHSVNVNCEVHDGHLYVHSFFAARKRWTAMAEANSHVRVLIDGHVYELRAVRIENEAERRSVLSPDGGEPAESTWLYRLDPRGDS